MVTVNYPEFRDSLENTKYPFIPSATLTNGNSLLLEGTFLDACIYAAEGTFRYYISSVIVRSGSLTINIGDFNSTIRLSADVEFPITDSVVKLKDVYGKPGGVLVTSPDRLSLLTAWGVGVHKFELTQTEFCTTASVPTPASGITGFRLPNGDTVSGTVVFVGENGIRFTAEIGIDDYGNDINRIIPNAVGDPQYLIADCTDFPGLEPAYPIRAIRVVHSKGDYLCYPDDTGNFTLQMSNDITKDAALRIRTTTEGIVITITGLA